MRFLFSLYISGFLVCLFFAPSSVFANDDKALLIPRQTIERAKGSSSVCGPVARVGHESIVVSSKNDGRTEVDLDDIEFPRPVKEIFDKDTRVIATGRFKGDTLIARRIVVIKGENRSVYVSRKPVEIRIKGDKNTKVQVVD